MPADVFLALTNDPLEQYVARGARIEPSAFNPRRFFSHIHVAYQYHQEHREVVTDGLTVHRIRRTRGVGPLSKPWHFTRSALYFARGVESLVRTQHVSLIRAYSPFTQAAVGTAVQSRTGVPCIVGVHSDYERAWREDPTNTAPRALFRLFYRYAVRRAAFVFCVSSYLRELALQQGAPPERTGVIFNKVDCERFRSRSPQSEAAVRARYGLDRRWRWVLFVGRLVPEKNLCRLVQAFAMVHAAEPGVRLALAGDSSERGALEGLTEEVGVRDAVRFLGTVPHDGLPDLLHLGEVLAFPSLNEGFPHVLVEAQAAGLPVVASTIPQLADIVDETNALFFDPHDVRAMAVCLLRLLGDQPLAQELAARGLETVQRFDRARLDELEVSYYEQVLASWSGRK